MGDLSARAVTFRFPASDRPVVAAVDLAVAAGDQVALVGPSGSGKSTLLHLLAGILVPAEGVVDYDDQALSRLDADGRAEVRLREFGFVFQFAELLPELTLAENVELPLRMLGRRGGETAVLEAMDRLGVATIADQLPSRVSGGERQRAAIARAMVHAPRVVFADEPTGALDQENGELVITTLQALCRDSDASLVVVTHDVGVAGHLDRTVRLRDGQLEAVVVQ
jgi:putative ABC transport system ATP-binding protein